MNILIIDDYSISKATMLALLCSKMEIPMIVVDKKESYEKEDLDLILEKLALLKPPSIPILEIPIFEALPTKELQTFFPRVPEKILAGARYVQSIHIRSPCVRGSNIRIYGGALRVL